MIIISPSGNLYGSESVLIDYLGKSKIGDLKVFVPANSVLFAQLKINFPELKVKSFSNLYYLYASIILLLFTKIEKVVYCNEGGHIRYLIFLAKFFRGVNFFNHIRIIEDTSEKRLGIFIYNNLTHLVISDYIGNRLGERKYIKIYDPYPFKNKSEWKEKLCFPIKIGIVGRVTPTKGLTIILKIISYLNEKTYNEFEFHFFGDIETDKKEVVEFVNYTEKLLNVKCGFHGFIKNKSRLYNNIDLLFHANKQEALGRVVLEALDYSKPVIGVNKGGIYELFKLVGISQFCIDLDDNEYFKHFYKLTQEMIEPEHKDPFILAGEKARKIFNDTEYAKELDSILTRQI